jgi:outer membrane receptor protein involved in Fe transport
LLSYDIDDRLGNRPSQDRAATFLPGYRRSAQGLAAGPRASLEYKALPWLSLLAAYGEGYRSPQARLLADGETAPFTKVHSGDAGLRFHFGDPLEMAVSGYWTRLSDDIAFDASEGALTRIGPTERLGGTFYALSRPADWMLTSLSVTYVHAVLLAPPPASAAEPNPPYVPGQAVPYVPPVVVRVDSTARRELLRDLAGHPLQGRIGVGLSFLGGRPLPYGQTAVPVGLIDASLGLGWGIFQLGVEGYNLLNQNYAASEYSFVSNWSPASPPSRLPARHIAAGSPLTILGTLGVTL